MIIERPNMVLPYDIDEVRADFPILHQEHSPGKPLVYLDNAASSQKSLSVIESMSDYYLRYNANVHRGIHKLSEEATSAYEGVRKNVKRFINADNHREVIFVRGTTEAFNLVAQTWGRANLQAGDVVLSTQMEHHANIVPWQMLAAEKGIKVLYAPITEKGMLDMDAFVEMLHNNPVKLVTLAHASNMLGTVIRWN